MKLSKSTKWLVLFLSAFLLLGQATMVWAQGEEDHEEEEPLQARPNPMEKTGAMERGANTQKGTQMQMKQRAGEQKANKAHTGMSNKANRGALKGQAAHPGGAMQQTPGGMR